MFLSKQLKLFIFVKCCFLSKKATVAESETCFYLERFVEKQLVICGTNVS